MNNEETPLVSIVVITYNSSKYVLETLESCKNQTYKNIEIIISDDASTDNTLEVCKKWLNKHHERFVNTKLVKADKNSGISSNCNRGVSNAKGEWVKLIAGDDYFINDGIENVISNLNPDMNIIDSKVSLLDEETKIKKEYIKYNSEFFNKESNDQLKMLAKCLKKKRIISTVGVFYKKELFDKIGGYDNNFQLLEDTPFWFRVLENEYKFHFINKETVVYRKHKQSVSTVPNSNFVISDFEQTVNLCIRKYAFKHLPFIYLINEVWLNIWYYVILILGNKGGGLKNLYYIINMIQPVRILWIKRKLKKNV